MWKRLKKVLPYIVVGFAIYAVVFLVPYGRVILNIIKCPSSISDVYVSSLDAYLGIVSGGIAIFSLWALVMTVFSVTKLSDIKRTRDKVKKTRDKIKKINKSILWQHMLQLNYAGQHRPETILLCRQVLNEGDKVNEEVRLYVMDTLIKTYIEVYSDLKEEDRNYKEFLRSIIHDEMYKAIGACQKFLSKQKSKPENPTVKNLQADIYFERGCFEGLCKKYEASIVDIKQAITINEEVPSYYRNLAVSQCLTQKCDYVEEAVKNLNRALELSDRHRSEAWNYNRINILDVFDDGQWDSLSEETKEKLRDQVCGGKNYRERKRRKEQSKT